MSHRPGLTLVELVLVMTIMALISAIGVHELRLQLDRIAVRGAVAEAATVVTRARDEARAQRSMVDLHIDTARGTILLRTRGQRVAYHALGHAHGVSLSTNRDSILFDARGLGYGAANLTLVVRRGRAVDTLVVSRLGRTRY